VVRATVHKLSSQDFSQFAGPDFLIRRKNLTQDLARLFKSQLFQIIGEPLRVFVMFLNDPRQNLRNLLPTRIKLREGDQAAGRSGFFRAFAPRTE
jgi:hypothetical protein